MAAYELMQIYHMKYYPDMLLLKRLLIRWVCYF
jgi:hypothetical protein